MNKITTINLNSQAYQLEEAAYEALHRYLEQARTKLAGDPDLDDVMQDFEQAIADKCNQVLGSHKNVVTAAEMHKIIASMGPVEVDDDADEHKSHDSDTTPPIKRLYTLRDGAIFGGVCSGLAAYFNIDVTVVRVLFIILTISTGGGWILAYFLILMFAPEAKTLEQKAELRGQRFTAQDLLTRAQKKYSDLGGEERLKAAARATTPALSHAGKVLLQIFSIVAGLCAGLVALTIVSLTMGLAVGSWAISYGNLQLKDQLAMIPHWEMQLALVAGYLLVTLPLVFFMQVFITLARQRQFSRQNALRWIAGAGLWFVAIVVAICISWANHGRVNAYTNSHQGYIDVRGHHLCLNDSLCGSDPNDCEFHYAPGVGRSNCIRTCPVRPLLQK